MRNLGTTFERLLYIRNPPETRILIASLELGVYEIERERSLRGNFSPREAMFCIVFDVPY